MNLDRVPSGADLPNEINVIIEIPSHSDPVKYEVDKKTGAMFVDHFMGTAMYYPCNFGYVPYPVKGRRPGRCAGGNTRSADYGLSHSLSPGRCLKNDG